MKNRENSSFIAVKNEGLVMKYLPHSLSSYPILANSKNKAKGKEKIKQLK